MITPLSYPAQIYPVKHPANMVALSLIIIAFLGLVIIMHNVFKSGPSDETLISEDMNKIQTKI